MSSPDTVLTSWNLHSQIVLAQHMFTIRKRHLGRFAKAVILIVTEKSNGFHDSLLSVNTRQELRRVAASQPRGETRQSK
jgi:hypothetical protein